MTRAVSVFSRLAIQRASASRRPSVSSGIEFHRVGDSAIVRAEHCAEHAGRDCIGRRFERAARQDVDDGHGAVALAPARRRAA